MRTIGDDSDATAPTPRRFLAIALGFEFGLGAFALALALLLDLHPWLDLRWDGWLLPMAVAGTLPMLAVLPLVAGSRGDWAARLRRLLDEHVRPLFAGLPGWAVAAVALAAGVGEELLFRGVLQAGLVAVSGPVVALIVASLLFGLAHALTPSYFVLATLMGLYLGGVYLATGNLLVVILVHFFYDWIALAWLMTRRPARA